MISWLFLFVWVSLRALEEMLLASGCVDLDALGLIPGKTCWILQIEVQAMDYAGGLFDSVCLAVKAALLTCRVPRVQVVRSGDAEDPEDREVRLVEPGSAAANSSDGQNELDQEFMGLSLAGSGSVVGTGVYRGLPLREVPTCVTLTKIGDCFVVDPSLEEEACMDAQCCVGVIPAAPGSSRSAKEAPQTGMRVCHISKRGAGGLAAATMEQMVQVGWVLGLITFVDVVL